MKSILHICVNFNNPIFQKLLKDLNHYCSKQIVIYPVSSKIRPQNDINEKADNIKVFFIQLSSIINKFSYPYKIIKTTLRTRKIVKSKDYEVIHAHTLFSDGGVALALNIIYSKS